MNLALDTNAYSDLQRGLVPKLKVMVENADLIILPFAVVGELKAGFHKGDQTENNYAKLYRFIDMDRVSVIWPDTDTIELYAKIWAELAKAGTPIPTNDIWIAAICLQHNLVLATDDTNFNAIALLQATPTRFKKKA